MIFVEDFPLGEMKENALSTFPDECVGFLYGREKDETRVISKIWKVSNARQGDKRRRFEITGKDYMQAERYALDNDITLLGIYHSHPGHPAIPSEHDRIAAQPYFSYVIISVTSGAIDHIRSWRLNDEAQFEEEIFSPAYITNPSHGNSNYSNTTQKIYQSDSQASD